MRFGRLIVLKRTDIKKGKYVYWDCICDCGNKTTVAGRNLKMGSTSSCGCLRIENTIKHNKNMDKSIRCKKVKENKYDLSDDYGKCYSVNNDEILFDLEDYDLISNYYWRVVVRNNCNYKRVMTKINGVEIPMHKVITRKSYLDHENRNPLDNRKSNLREATFCQNSSNRTKQSNNTSGVIGVVYRTDSDKWEARININKKETKLGVYINFVDAVIVRLNAEREYYGEFAPQKHLYKQYGIEE
jgi:hypothetical protein